MVDDSPEKLSQHYGNHIRVLPIIGDASDDELLRLAPFVVRIAESDNFRVVTSSPIDCSTIQSHEPAVPGCQNRKDARGAKFFLFSCGIVVVRGVGWPIFRIAFAFG